MAFFSHMFRSKRAASNTEHDICSPLKHEEYCLYLQQLRTNFQEIWNTPMSSEGSPADFEMIKVVGTGAFGIVCFVKHLPTEKYYAMKLLEKKKVIEMKQLKHSYNEKKILCAIDFPFVVSMRYFFKDNVYLYFILPFVQGGDMFGCLRSAGRFRENQSKFYAAQVLLALEYLHACDLVYRDLKPENILIDANGYLKLTDFGFCKIIQGRTYTLCGTPEYLAPEIILNKGYGFSVDWWSYGVLLYEMSAGFAPFYGADAMKIYEKAVSCKYKCPGHFSNNLKDLISHTIKVDTARRYGNLKNGTNDIKSHSWFKDLDWEGVLLCKVPAPFVPIVNGPEDASNYDHYDDVKLKQSPVCLYAEEFADF